MVVAYLQGLLRHSHKFGRRSMFTEEIVFEAISANFLVDNMRENVAHDLALLPLLTVQGVRETSEVVSARLARAAELRLLDIYKVSDQISGKLKVSNSKHELSLFQLYQIAEKTGIFEAFDEHYTVENSRPLL